MCKTKQVGPRDNTNEHVTQNDKTLLLYKYSVLHIKVKQS